MVLQPFTPKLRTAMTPDPAQATKALEALFRTYPGFKADDLAAMVKTYLHAVSIYETRDVIQGISDFITGNVPGHNPAFAPSAPQVGSAVRRAMERRVEAERLDRLQLPPPSDDFQQDPPEVRAKNKARLDALAASLASSMDMDRAPLRDLQRRTNERFDPPAYSVGDPDAENDMGGEKVA
jgi:hypothetical protein